MIYVKKNRWTLPLHMKSEFLTFAIAVIIQLAKEFDPGESGACIASLLFTNEMDKFWLIYKDENYLMCFNATVKKTVAWSKKKAILSIKQLCPCQENWFIVAVKGFSPLF